jgi:ribose-phosphate pyrophosphokinase
MDDARGAGPGERPASRDRAVHAFEDSRDFAEQLARCAGLACLPVSRHAFPDGEVLVSTAPDAPPGAVLVRSLHQPNAKLFEVLLAADALRRCGAQQVTLVAPYLPYLRQDRVFEVGQALSQHVMAQLLGPAFDRVLCVEPHLHRLQRLEDAFPCAAAGVSAAPAVARWLEACEGPLLLVGPDEESEPWIREIASRVGSEWVVGRKQREGDADVQVAFENLPAAGHAVLIDDIASSGATLAQAARALRQRGVARIDAVVVHAIFAAGALERIRAAGVARIVSCDTIPHPTNEIRVASLVAGLL